MLSKMSQLEKRLQIFCNMLGRSKGGWESQRSALEEQEAGGQDKRLSGRVDMIKAHYTEAWKCPKTH